MNNNLTSIADSGTELEILKSLRHKLAETIEQSQSGRDVASLSRQLRDVLARISEIENNEKENKDISMLDLVMLKSRLEDKTVRKRNREDYEDYEDDAECLDVVDEMIDYMNDNGVTSIKDIRD